MKRCTITLVTEEKQAKTLGNTVHLHQINKVLKLDNIKSCRGSPPFSWLKNIPLCVCTTSFLSIAFATANCNWLDLWHIILNKISKTERSTTGYHLYVDSKNVYPIKNRVKWCLPEDGRGE